MDQEDPAQEAGKEKLMKKVEEQSILESNLEDWVWKCMEAGISRDRIREIVDSALEADIEE